MTVDKAILPGKQEDNRRFVHRITFIYGKEKRKGGGKTGLSRFENRRIGKAEESKNK